MIVRIMAEGQRELSEEQVEELNAADAELQRAVDAGDEASFRAALDSLLSRVRELGRTLPEDSLDPSDLLLPHADASLADVRQMLGDEGLIPG